MKKAPLTRRGFFTCMVLVGFEPTTSKSVTLALYPLSYRTTSARERMKDFHKFWFRSLVDTCVLLFHHVMLAHQRATVKKTRR